MSRKISVSQLAAMLLIPDAFGIFCIRGSISLLTAAGYLTGTLMQAAMSVPLLFLEKRGYRSRLVQAYYLVYTVFCGATLFSVMNRAAGVLFIPYENASGTVGRILTALLVGGVCLYASSCGIKALSRAAFIAAAAGSVCIIIVMVNSAVSFPFSDITRAESSRTFTEEVINGFAVSGSFGCLALLLRRTDENIFRSAAVYFTGKTVITAALLLTSLLAAGGIMKITDMPVITAAQLSQPFPVQRIDSLFLIIFAVFAVFSVSVQTACASQAAGEVFTGFRRFRNTAVFLLIAAAAPFTAEISGYPEIYAAAAMTSLALIPAAVLIIKYFRKERGKCH